MTNTPDAGLSLAEATELQESWEAQQEPFLPHRSDAFDALVAAAVDAAPGDRAGRVLELAGGTGSITMRLLEKAPQAQVTVLEVDPVLAAIAGASLRGRAPVVEADLSDPGWISAIPCSAFDAVLVGNALHCFPPERLRELYREIRTVVTPGGRFALAEVMPETNTGEPSNPTGAASSEVARQAVRDWDEWWTDALGRRSLQSEAVRRSQLQVRSADMYPDLVWHRAALRDAGFAHTSVAWRKADTVVLVAA
jgi:SAM-dependent methyltransferase